MQLYCLPAGWLVAPYICIENVSWLMFVSELEFDSGL